MSLDGAGRLSGQDTHPLAKKQDRPTDPAQLETWLASWLVGNSQVMKDLRVRILRLGRLPLTVRIVGPTGSGKELVAYALAHLCAQYAGKFVAFNAATVTDSLADSMLFGHERGAFTGALRRRIGLFEQADGGTLFIDEIAELSLPNQARLLRVLQEREFTRVGGTDLITVNLRVICATHRDLGALVREGRFREDLFYRVSTACVQVPSLRERLDDLPLLVDVLAARVAREWDLSRPRFEENALAHLARHEWPGNVRELENAIRILCALAVDGVVTRELVDAEVVTDAEISTDATYLSKSCRSCHVEALLRAAGSARRAAALLSCSTRWVEINRRDGRKDTWGSLCERHDAPPDET